MGGAYCVCDMGFGAGWAGFDAVEAARLAVAIEGYSELSLFGLIFGDDRFDDVAHFFVLGLEVAGEGILRDDFGGDTLDDADAGGFEGGDLLGVVGDEADLGDAESIEDLCGEFIGTAVGGKAELYVGLDSVATVVLEFVGAKLGHEANAAAFLLFVEENSCAFCGDALECELKLKAAIAAEGAEDISGEALGVDSNDGSRGGRRCVNIAHDEGDQLFGGARVREGWVTAGFDWRGRALKAKDAEMAPAGGEIGFSDLLCRRELHASILQAA